MDVTDLPRLSPKALGQDPGWWVWTLRKDGTDGLIMLHCSCGKNGQIMHEIAADGVVSPSLVCGWQCGYHVNARMVGWDGGERPRVTS